MKSFVALLVLAIVAMTSPVFANPRAAVVVRPRAAVVVAPRLRVVAPRVVVAPFVQRQVIVAPQRLVVAPFVQQFVQPIYQQQSFVQELAVPSYGLQLNAGAGCGQLLINGGY